MLGIDVQERVAFISELSAHCPYLVLRSLSLIVTTHFKYRLASIERIKAFSSRYQIRELLGISGKLKNRVIS